MKKLVLFVAVAVAVSFASCKQKAAPAPEEAPEVDGIENVVEPTEEVTGEEIAIEEATPVAEEVAQ